MTPPQVKKKELTLEEQLLELPENFVGEIVDGELFVSPRPAPKHSFAESGLTELLRSPFQSGRGGGPGGWWILPEPELHLSGQTMVPDLAGRRKKRMPDIPDEAFISVVPDWACEILSPGNARLDRKKKIPAYGALGVKHLWLVDPKDKTLVIHAQENGSWRILGAYVGSDLVRAEPFDAIGWSLGDLWPDTPPPAAKEEPKDEAPKE